MGNKQENVEFVWIFFFLLLRTKCGVCVRIDVCGYIYIYIYVNNLLSDSKIMKTNDLTRLHRRITEYLF